jgi:peptidoglycan hydrolase FlgJ
VINSLNNQTPATAGEASRRQELRQAAQAFEAVFIRQLVGSMRSARLAEDMFGSQATEQFRDMADARLADSMAQQGTFGIADLLTAQFERHRSVQAPTAGTQAGTSADGGRHSDEVTR